MQWTREEMNKTLAAINKKVQSDASFRSLCLKKPNEAVQQISGKEVPSGFKLRFIENENVHMTHVLPDYVGPGHELTEQELEQVAAGVSFKGDVVCPNCGSTNTTNQKTSFYCENCEHKW